METIFEVKTVKAITEDHISGVITTSLEGGSNYWYLIDRDQLSGISEDRSIPLSERISKALSSNKSARVPIYDIENPDDLLGTVTQESLKKAFEKAAEEYPTSFNAIMNDTYDAIDADIVFQLATMNDVVFG